VEADRIAQFLNCSIELVREKLVFGERLQPEDVPRWIENLRSIFSDMILEKKALATSVPRIESGFQQEVQPVSTEFDRQAVKDHLPPELQNHPILLDVTTWDDYFIKNNLGGPQWSRRISRELDLAGIYTVADMALLVMVLGLQVSHKNSWGNFYIFDRALPSGYKPYLRTKHFGPWSWKMVLERLQKGGLNWQEYLSK